MTTNIHTRDMRPVATDKGIEGLAEVAQEALAVDYAAAKGAIADAQAALKRIIRLARNLPEGMADWKIKASRGPTLDFTGKQLCAETFTTRGRDPLEIEMAIFQTEGGALVAMSSAMPAEREGHETIDAVVVEPSEDIQAMRFAVMDFFNWELRARSMVTKKLNWSLRRDVP